LKLAVVLVLGKPVEATFLSLFSDRDKATERRFAGDGVAMSLFSDRDKATERRSAGDGDSNVASF
jgi:hypothetical protein